MIKLILSLKKKKSTAKKNTGSQLFQDTVWTYSLEVQSKLDLTPTKTETVSAHAEGDCTELGTLNLCFSSANQSNGCKIQKWPPKSNNHPHHSRCSHRCICSPTSPPHTHSLPHPTHIHHRTCLIIIFTIATIAIIIAS